MAVKDVRKYFYTMLCQYIEEKQNLADFEEALKDGNITQEQMQEALENVASLETNYLKIFFFIEYFSYLSTNIFSRTNMGCLIKGSRRTSHFFFFFN